MIFLSRAAIHEVNRLRYRSGNVQRSPSSILRLGVESGGCSDFYYTLEFVSAPQSSDRVWNCDDLQVVVDAHSLRYLDGLTIDYSEDLMGGGFRFDNPNAQQHCGCGNSFTPIATAQ